MLVALEIISNINKRNDVYNVVVKLDMIKAYDRVSWIYHTKVMRRLDFDEKGIDIV